MKTEERYQAQIHDVEQRIHRLTAQREQLIQRKAQAATRKGMEQWKGFRFESSSGLTEEFADFAKDFKSYLRKALPSGACLADFNRGHFYVSGFISNGAKYVYFSVSDVRYFPDEWANNILIRTAKHDKDFTGGSNQYTTLENFTKNVERLLS